MKKFVGSLAMLLWSTWVFAVVHHVNNSNPSPGEFSSLQLAINTAVAGDTIYIAGTGINYGGVNMDKQLSLIGPGVTVTGVTISNVAQTGSITMTSTSTSGSKFIGIRFFQLISTDAATSTYTNLTIQRCIIDDCLFLSNDDWSGCLVEGCLFTSVGPSVTATLTTANLTASTMRNNIINGTSYYISGNLIENNIYPGVSNGNTAIISGGTGNTFQNNIAIGRNCNSIDVTSNCTGNMSYVCLNPNFTGTGNYPNVNPMFVFYNATLFSWNHDFHLNVGSPALGAGVGGVDLGVYDGDGIYRKDHEPDVPVVRNVTLPGGNVIQANSSFIINVTTVTHE